MMKANDLLYKKIEKIDLIDTADEAKAALKIITHRYSNLVNSISVGYFILDDNGIILEVNHAALTLLGLKDDSIIAKNIDRFLTPEGRQAFSTFFDECKHELNETKQCFLQLMRKNFPLIDCRVEGKLVKHELTGKKEFQIFIFNLSGQIDSNTKEDKGAIANTLFQQNSINELANILAHELNNPLSIILNYVQGSIRRLESGSYNMEEILNALKTASAQSLRANELILRMKRFHQNRKMIFENCNLATIITDVFSIINADISNYPVELKLRSLASPFVRADTIYLTQILLNLVRNSLDAIKDANIEEGQIIVELNRIDVDKIKVMIIDNGPGFPPDTADLLFSPHYTTKSYGIGIGLALSQSLVIAHESMITASNNKHARGATFEFTLTSVAEI